MAKIKAYDGNDPYIFVSYSHDDNKVVLPIIEKLQEKYNVWFDDGIHFGEDYKKTIIKHINNCEVFLYMVSINSLTSEFCKKEIKQADRKKRFFFNVIIEDCLDSEEAEEFMFDYENLQMCMLYTMTLDDLIEDLERKAPIILHTVKKVEAPVKKEKLIPPIKKEEELFPTYGEQFVEWVKENTEEIAKRSNKEHLKGFVSLIGGAIDEFFKQKKINAQVVSFDIGRVYTRYNILASDDDKIKIKNSVNELIIAIKTFDIRFVEAILGKPKLCALEVLHEDVEVLPYKYCYNRLNSKTVAPFDIPLGVTVDDELISLDLEKSPHLIINGSAGGGKSIFLHTLISTLILRTPPSAVKFILYDSKHIEFNRYKDEPHLLGPVINDIGQVLNTFIYLSDLIIEREQLFVRNNVSNIFQYNTLIRSSFDKIPYIFMVIDEAEEIAYDKDMFKKFILFILKKGKDAGVHLVISSQIIVDFITNDLDISRLIFSQVDPEESVFLMGSEDATLLRGRGDAFIIQKEAVNTGLPTRILCPFIDNKEIKQFVNLEKEEYGESKTDIDYNRYLEHGLKVQKYKIDNDTYSLQLDENQQNAENTTRLINEFFLERKIDAKAVNYVIGSSITRYHIECGMSTSVKTVGKVISDLALRLGNLSIRFEPILVGTTYSAIELPNKVIKEVKFQEILSSLDKSEDHPLQIGFGLDPNKNVVKGDIDSFPHMIVAGTTGSGKSIFLHNVISTLILRNSPDNLRLVLVDPKHVEMNCYRDMPHLCCPIIKDAKEVIEVLDYLNEEMNKRYEDFAETNAVNIKERNQLGSSFFTDLAHIVVVIDEYADLVDQDKNISTKLLPIIQKARASGIHVIIATQRPSVNVISGVIKANMPTHVALMTANTTDSFVLLGESGAENLLGKGDMLIQSPTISRVGLIRAQAPMIKRSEINSIVDGLKKRYKTNYLYTVKKEEKVFNPIIEGIAQEDEERRYQSVKEWVLTQEYMSMSRIQRECAVSFNRAGKYFNRLIEEGIIEKEPYGSRGHRVIKEPVNKVESNKEERSPEEVKKYNEIKEWVLTQDYMSMSRIQRECGVGFNRAGRFFRWLIEDGILDENDATPKGFKVIK